MIAVVNIQLLNIDEVQLDIVCECGEKLPKLWTKKSAGFKSFTGQCPRCGKYCKVDALQRADGVWDFQVVE